MLWSRCVLISKPLRLPCPCEQSPKKKKKQYVTQVLSVTHERNASITQWDSFNLSCSHFIKYQRMFCIWKVILLWLSSLSLLSHHIFYPQYVSIFSFLNFTSFFATMKVKKNWLFGSINLTQWKSPALWNLSSLLREPHHRWNKRPCCWYDSPWYCKAQNVIETQVVLTVVKNFEHLCPQAEIL